MGKKILSILDLGIVLIGIVFGGNLVLILVGAILLGLGQVSKENGTNSKNKQVFHEFFDDVNIDPVSHLLDVSDTNIPLPKHDYCSGSGYVQGKYKGLDVEFCTIKLSDVTEVLRDETGLWEKNENQIYEGQWMFCKLDHEFSTWLTIYSKDRMDKFMGVETLKTGDEAFDKKFNLSCGDQEEALKILDSSCLEKIITLTNGPFRKFAFNLNMDGKLYIAAHSGHGFESASRDELKWFKDWIDVLKL